ncbi:hypothetical protein BH11PSE11_BH11PSE11_28170 [soil metagenome]
MRPPLLCKYVSLFLLATGMCAFAQAETLPADLIKWETVPAAIRADGTDSFTIQVYVPQGAKTVTIKPISGQTQYITPAIGFAGITLKDDGLGADKVAGDKIFTAGPFKYDTAKAFPTNFGSDAKSPAGVFVNVLGTLNITFTDSVTYPAYASESRDPAVGLVKKDLPAATLTQLNATTLAASHMINIQSDRFDSERYMRAPQLGGDTTALSRSVYAALPDNYDQLLVFSTYTVQGVRNDNRGSNGNSGIHYMVKNDIKGIGLSLFDNTSAYGSAGRLRSINAFWAYGTQSPLVTHEISHTWQAYLTHPNYTLQNSGHWYANNSLGSLWKDNGNGTFNLDCTTQISKASNMSQYLMGIAPSSSVEHVRVLQNNEQFGTGYECGKQITKPFATLSINDIITANGAREPAYGQAPKNFQLLFVAQSVNRALNATEMTFFNTLAKHLAVADNTVSVVPPLAWRPLSSFYPGTTWQTAVSTGGGSDTVAPVITLAGAASMNVALNSTFTDPGATAQDNVDGNISASIVKTGTVNTAAAGTYTLRYNVRDAAGNAAVEAVRTVVVASQAAACFKATNYQHVAAGRAYQQTVNFVTNAYANGSNENLGSYGSSFYSPTTSLKQASAGVWNKVTACP